MIWTQEHCIRVTDPSPPPVTFSLDSTDALLSPCSLPLVTKAEPLSCGTSLLSLTLDSPFEDTSWRFSATKDEMGLLAIRASLDTNATNSGEVGYLLHPSSESVTTRFHHEASHSGNLLSSFWFSRQSFNTCRPSTYGIASWQFLRKSANSCRAGASLARPILGHLFNLSLNACWILKGWPYLSRSVVQAPL